VAKPYISFHFTSPVSQFVHVLPTQPASPEKKARKKRKKEGGACRESVIV